MAYAADLKSVTERYEGPTPSRATKFEGVWMYFWHVHHDYLIEWAEDIARRIEYIKTCSAADLRLRLLRPANIGNLTPNCRTGPVILQLHKVQCDPQCPWTPASADNWGGLIGTIFPRTK